VLLDSRCPLFGKPIWRAEAGEKTGQESRSDGRGAATSVTAMEITLAATEGRPPVARSAVSPSHRVDVTHDLKERP